MRQFHFSLETVDTKDDIYYRYIPDKDVQDIDTINIVRLPHWSTRYGIQQISSLWFISLSKQNLSTTQFDLESDIDGLGTLSFDKSALEEFILLLKKHMKPEF